MNEEAMTPELKTVGETTYPDGKESPGNTAVFVRDCELVPGECYVFSSVRKDRGDLWGLFDKREDGAVRLEALTADLLHFRKYTLLPEGYDAVRPASRDELRDFSYNLGFSEA